MQALTLGLGSYCAWDCNVMLKEDLSLQRTSIAGSPIASYLGYPQKLQPCLFPQVLNPDFPPPPPEVSFNPDCYLNHPHCQLHTLRASTGMGEKSNTASFNTTTIFQLPWNQSIKSMHRTDSCNPPNQLLLQEISLCHPSKTVVSYSFFPLHFPSARLLWAQEHVGITQSMPLKAHHYANCSAWTWKHTLCSSSKPNLCSHHFQDCLERGRITLWHSRPLRAHGTAGIARGTLVLLLSTNNSQLLRRWKASTSLEKRNGSGAPGPQVTAPSGW